MQTRDELGAATEQSPSSQDQQAFEKTKERLMQLAREGKKPLLFVPPLSTQSSVLLDTGLSQLAALKEKISDIQAKVGEQSAHIHERLQKLRDNPIIKIDAENKEAKASVEQYTQLLNRIAEEIDFESSLLTNYCSLEEQTVLPVWAYEPDDFDAYIKLKIGRVKKQIKKIERDLNVSFSRYQFSFDKQCKNLANMEALIAYNIKLQEVATAKKNSE